MDETRQREQFLWMGRGNVAIEADIQELIVARITHIDHGLQITVSQDFTTTDALNLLPVMQANNVIPIRGVFTRILSCGGRCVMVRAAGRSRGDSRTSTACPCTIAATSAEQEHE